MENNQQFPCSCPPSQQSDWKICEYNVSVAFFFSRHILPCFIAVCGLQSFEHHLCIPEDDNIILSYL